VIHGSFIIATIPHDVAAQTIVRDKTATRAVDSLFPDPGGGLLPQPRID
jgi:hypothetical protein